MQKLFTQEKMGKKTELEDPRDDDMCAGVWCSLRALVHSISPVDCWVSLSSARPQ